MVDSKELLHKGLWLPAASRGPVILGLSASFVHELNSLLGYFFNVGAVKVETAF